ncbi:hypothetical protein KDW19_22040 [Burkholderia cenocepacia]|uniref:hypothetical protein n=1 Tax=Burkholderia cepacia complex TaxID=87882 RepID=UPI001624E36D|nr:MULTISPECIES: hypothetical protein [Burkholderia cepacia complex]ELW9448822.1 hypothetical protein [Burkholderia cenocepacia]MBR8485143.1 hypothetical protein [Burkholderia cenocepacia]MDN7470483.1 hypothetical protein [Burkholderia orbicola]MDN7501866.1 hypothetical protein [Burkholderia orbicola]
MTNALHRKVTVYGKREKPVIGSAMSVAGMLPKHRWHLRAASRALPIRLEERNACRIIQPLLRWMEVIRGFSWKRNVASKSRNGGCALAKPVNAAFPADDATKRISARPLP